MWLALHLVLLVGLRNRLSVFAKWIYSYFNYWRGARIIMGADGRVRADHRHVRSGCCGQPRLARYRPGVVCCSRRKARLR